MTWTPQKKITEKKRTEGGGETWVETVDDLQVIRTRTVTAEPWKEERYACFCCTCDAHDEEGMSSMSDPYCRNHNMGFGMRPCDIHGIMGQREIDPETDVEGDYPMPVREYRESVRARK